MKDQNQLILEPINFKIASISIEGDGDLVLNKMNARTVRELIGARDGNKTVREVPNVWEDIATAIEWKDPIGLSDTYTKLTEDYFKNVLLKENSPCISGFGLKKSFNQAVVRNEIDTYSTKFDNAVNVINGKIPVQFSSWSLDERLMSPKKGAPVLVRINHFYGWSAFFDIKYTDHVYSLDQIVNIINLAGFGLGIGSGRSSGYGRYHVVGVEA